MSQDKQADPVKINLWSVRIVKIHLDCSPILNTLFLHGDDCRLELDNFSCRYPMDLLPYSVLKFFRTNMSCVCDGVFPLSLLACSFCLRSRFSCFSMASMASVRTLAVRRVL